MERGTEVGLVASRGQDDCRAVAPGSELFSDHQAVDVRQMYVEEDDVRFKFPGGCEARLAAIRLADDDETLGFEQRTSDLAKAPVVVHDEDFRHRSMVADAARWCGTASHTLVRLALPAGRRLLTERKLDPEPRPASGLALELERALERFDSVGETAKPRPLGRVRSADAVVRDLDHDAAV